MEHIVAVLLHNIRSAHNVGSILRTADGAGVSCVYLSGYTPVPIDRFGRVQKDIAKTALGAEETVPWEYIKDARVAIEQLRSAGYTTIGVEQDARSRDYRISIPAERMLFVFGNEVRGLSKPVRDLCDQLVEIPMRGTKESLNVATAAGIVLYSAINT